MKVTGTPFIYIFFTIAVLLIGGLKWISWSQVFTQREWSRIVDGDVPPKESTQYVSSDQCRACHPDEYESWRHTYHRTMTQKAVPGNVLGDFSDTTIISDGLAYRVYQKGQTFWAEMPDPDEMMYVIQGEKKTPLSQIPRVHLPVVMTTGSHHYQTYWVGSPKYSLLMQTLPLIYLLKDQRWIPREAAFMFPPDEGVRFITQWNHHCIKCHSTGGVPGLDKESGMLLSSVGELGISCEACHGAGAEHVRRNQDPVRRYQSYFQEMTDPTIVNPENLDHRRSSQVCGQCHGVFTMRDEYAMKYAYEGIQYQPGEDLHRTRYYVQHPRNDRSEERMEDFRKNPEFFRERWWDDGSILAGGREFTAITETGCYTRGEMSCLSCHSMHHSDPEDQLKPGMRGDLACTQCHKEALYSTDIEKHSHHSVGSDGSRCQNCHMPYNTYALLGAIRSHQIETPRIHGSIQHGVPNACNLCHLDQTLEWTQSNMAKWYGTTQQAMSDEQKEISAALLWILKGDAAQRAVTAWNFGWKPAQEASGVDWEAPFIARLLEDPYGVVRYVAENALRTLPGFTNFKFDFLSSKEILKMHTEQVVKQWSSLPKDFSKPANSKVLLLEGGTIDEAKVQEILRERDNRKVVIKE